MGARQLLEHFADVGLTVFMEGDLLKVRPASLVNQPIREIIQQNKASLLAALSQTAPYWLVGEAMVIAPVPLASYAEVRESYPSQEIEPLDEMPRDRTPSHPQIEEVESLTARLWGLRGTFYADDEIRRALNVLGTQEGFYEVLFCVGNAEKQAGGIACSRQPNLD
jgi:hypothetical protein